MKRTCWLAVILAGATAVRAAELQPRDRDVVLRDTGLAMLVWAVAVALALVFG